MSAVFLQFTLSTFSVPVSKLFVAIWIRREIIRGK